ncbi:MAG: chloride channel protein, partial [Anaerolineales bacterium]
TFTRSLYAFEDLFDGWSRPPEWLKPAVGGALLGLLAIGYPLIRLAQPVNWVRVPQVFNVGYDIIESALANEIALSAAFILLIAKVLATNLTLGSGGSGGVFAPSLFMGAMLGVTFELGVGRLIPGILAPPGAYALVGMAAVFAAASHAPITAVLILFELTGDYRIILPLMLTVVAATLISQKMLRGESIYTLKLTRRNIRLTRGRDLDILHSVQVGEVMTREYKSIREDATIEEVSEGFANSRSRSQLILDDEGNLAGLVTLSDLERAIELDGPQTTTARSVASTWPNLLVTYSDESVGEALARMGTRGIGRLPVVSRKDERKVRGLISRIGITKAYALALSRRAELELRTEELEQQYQGDAQFVEIVLKPSDLIVGKQLREIAAELPNDSILVSVIRDDRTIIPHGDTVFEAGDRLKAYMRSGELEAFFDAIGEYSQEGLVTQGSDAT